MKKVFSVWSLTIFMVMCVGFSSCFGGGGNSGNSGGNSGISPSSISSVEDAKNYLNGITFIGTPSGDLWYKLEFSGDKVSVWSAMPRDGRWSVQLTSVSFTVGQGRYENTGQTYYVARFGDPDKPFNSYRFDITGKMLYLAIGGTGTPMKVGDRNPWN